MSKDVTHDGFKPNDPDFGAELRTENQKKMYRKAMQTWSPPARLTVSEWCEKHYIHEEGKMRLLEFQKGFLDAFSDSTIDRVTIKKSARVGLTMSMIIVICYYAAQDPMRVIMLQPTDDDCRGISIDDIGPAFERCPQTASLLGATKNARNTLTHKTFPGGYLKILAARSPRNLRRHNADVMLFDEIDGYETTSEGDPLRLGMRRVQNSPRAKIFMGSTPVSSAESKITPIFEDSDKRYFYVPCPHCGTDHTLEWENMYIDGTPIKSMNLRDIDKESDWRAHMRCEECEEDIHQDKKAWMVDNGSWVATAPFAGHAGFFINALYSTFPGADWQKLALEYLESKRTPDGLQTFVNTVLGMEFNDNLESVDEESVAKRRGKYNLDTVPADVLLITCGVDVQVDRAEITFMGHCTDGRVKILAHKKLYGDPTGARLWDDLDNLLEVVYTHQLGNSIGVTAAAIDSGNWTTAVYNFCSGKMQRGIYAIKGMPGDNRPIWAESKINLKVNAKLYGVGVDAGKRTLMKRLTVEEADSPAYIEFTEDLEFEYFEQLVSEYRKMEISGGRPKFSWERKKGRRAETLDCFVYGLAVFETLAPNWSRLRESLTASVEAPVKKNDDFGSLGSLAGNMQ